ncbi:MAG: 4-hydroxy-tetrahydrodipicolinate reductase [Nevskiaceae bacterium]
MRWVMVGAAGRMGQTITQLAATQPELRCVGAIDRAADAARGISTDLASVLHDADVMIDFSSPTQTAANLARCAERGVAALIGTTGLGGEVEVAAAAAAQHIPVLIAANTSLGVTLLAELVRVAARALPEGFDIEIFEGHHRHKKDAPSGTALALGRAAAAGRGQALNDVAVAPRGSGERKIGEIGFSVLRAGDIVGDHAVYFAGAGERLVLQHQATDRTIFARGALQAARFLIGKPAGRYSMMDVISTPR